ncbi:phage tail assembly protein [Bartonella sp. B39]
MTVQTSFTYELLVPVTFEGKEHTEITLRRPKTKDVHEVYKQKKPDITQILEMISRLSGWPMDAVEGIDSYDMDVIVKKTESFTKRQDSETGKLPRNS